MDRVKVIGTFDGQALDWLLDEKKITHIGGRAKESTIKSRLSHIIESNHERGVTFDLSAGVAGGRMPTGDGGRMLTADRVKAALAAGQLATLRAALEYDHKRTLLIIDDGNVFVGRLRMQLDGFVKICRPGSYVNIQGPVYDGNQLILESFSTLAESHAVSTYLPPPTLFELTDARWEKLEPVISKRSS